jgi:peroxiredoxin
MKRKLTIFFSLLLISSLSAVAAETTPLDEAREHYAKESTRAFTANISPLIPESSPMAGFQIPAIEYRVASREPNQVALRASGGAMEPSFVQTTNEQMTLLPFARSFVREELSVSIEELLAEPDALTVPGADLLIGLAFGAMSDLFSAESEIVKNETIDGVDCVRLKLSGARRGEVWIATGETPWIVRYLEASNDANVPVESEDGGGFAFQPRLDMHFSDWRSEATDDSIFELNPGIGFESVANVEEAMQRLQGGQPERLLAEDHPGVNKPAPDVTIKPMNGESFTLASRQGKIVVLDFWASWCKPCIIDMPLLIEALDGFSNEQVELWAVNRFESVETIENFLVKEKIDIPTALDPDNAVAAAFQVTGIPHVVVVDQNGVVRFVHVGSSFDNKDYLRGEIEALLGGAE